MNYLHLFPSPEKNVCKSLPPLVLFLFRVLGFRSIFFALFMSPTGSSFFPHGGPGILCFGNPFPEDRNSFRLDVPP